MAKRKISPDFQAEQRKQLERHNRKTVLFNDKELAVIEQYCKKYKVRSQSAFFREAIISKVLQQLDEDYPKLF